MYRIGAMAQHDHMQNYIDHIGRGPSWQRLPSFVHVIPSMATTSPKSTGSWMALGRGICGAWDSWHVEHRMSGIARMIRLSQPNCLHMYSSFWGSAWPMFRCSFERHCCSSIAVRHSQVPKILDHAFHMSDLQRDDQLAPLHLMWSCLAAVDEMAPPTRLSCVDSQQPMHHWLPARIHTRVGQRWSNCI